MKYSTTTTKKEFLIGFKKKTAVDNLSLDFYQNQITGLLGHNGAGKVCLFQNAFKTFYLLFYFFRSNVNSIILDNNNVHALW